PLPQDGKIDVAAGPREMAIHHRQSDGAGAGESISRRAFLRAGHSQPRSTETCLWSLFMKKRNLAFVVLGAVALAPLVHGEQPAHAQGISIPTAFPTTMPSIPGL